MGSNVTDVGCETKAVTHELKKHAATIHCSNTLTLLQRKITNALLYHAYRELLVKEEHEITIKHLCRLIDYNGNNHAVIKDALKGLLSTVIEWNVVSDTTGKEDWTASSMLASVSLRGPNCLYAYSPRMKQLLHSPTMFGKINLFIQSRFKSSYGLALYENCIRYRGLPQTKWFEIDIFRKLMGVPDGIYTIFRDFKRRVLDKSVEEVNTYSDLIVEPELLKERRQVTKVRFLLKERAKKTRLGINQTSTEVDEESEIEIKTKLIAQFGLSMEQVRQIVQEYSTEFIAEKIQLIESSKNYHEGKIHNIAGYFLSALKNNYQVAVSSLTQLSETRKNTESRVQTQKSVKRQLENIRKSYTKYRDEHIDRALAELSLADRKLLLEGFYQYAARAIETVLRLQKNKYTYETVIDSPQIKSQLRQFAVNEVPHLHEKIPSFDAFLKNLPENTQKLWQEQTSDDHILQQQQLEI